MRITINLTEIHKICIYIFVLASNKKSVDLIERKTNHHHLISKNEIVYDVVSFLTTFAFSKSIFMYNVDC